MVKDFIDLQIQNNLINQVRISTERTNKKLADNVKHSEIKVAEI